MLCFWCCDISSSQTRTRLPWLAKIRFKLAAQFSEAAISTAAPPIYNVCWDGNPGQWSCTKKLVWFCTQARILRCVPTGIIHDAIPWYYSNRLVKCPHFSISHKPNHVFISIINLKGTKTYTTTALRMVIEGQRSGCRFKIKIAGLVTKICNFSLWVQRCFPKMCYLAQYLIDTTTLRCLVSCAGRPMKVTEGLCTLFLHFVRGHHLFTPFLQLVRDHHSNRKLSFLSTGLWESVIALCVFTHKPILKCMMHKRMP